MKRLLTATALTTAFATAGFAATEAQENAIQSYLPGIDVQALSDTQVDTLLSLAYSGDTRADKVSAMSAYVEAPAMIDADISPAQMNDLMAFAPGVDFSGFSDAELAQALSVMHSGDSRGEALATLRAFEAADRTITTDPLTEAERLSIESYAPGIDLAALSDAEVLRIQAVIASGDDAQIRSVIRGIVNG